MPKSPKARNDFMEIPLEVSASPVSLVGLKFHNGFLGSICEKLRTSGLWSGGERPRHRVGTNR